MSYFSNTLFPVVESTFEGTRPSDLPKSQHLAAKKIRAAGYPREAAYVESVSRADLQNIYRYSNLVNPERDNEETAWEIAEQEWSGR
jgi:hypothetical protein